MNDIELYDIYDIWYDPPWFIRYYLVIIIVLGIIFLFGLAYYLYKRRTKRAKICWEIALERLAKLDQELSKDHKLFYFNLTGIIKEYLIARYRLDLESKTDAEMVENIKNYNLPEVITEDLKKVLSGTTMIKFANQKVDDAIVKNDLKIIIEMVKNTIPKEKINN
jgi:hypothetical protein